MCVVSMIMDQSLLAPWRRPRRYPDYCPWQDPWGEPFPKVIPRWKEPEIDPEVMKKYLEMESEKWAEQNQKLADYFSGLLRKAAEYDRKTGQPECPDTEKKKRLQALADELGVKIEFPEASPNSDLTESGAE